MANITYINTQTGLYKKLKVNTHSYARLRAHKYTLYLFQVLRLKSIVYSLYIFKYNKLYGPKPIFYLILKSLTASE